MMIPVTPIMLHYNVLRDMPQEERLKDAERFLKNPDELAVEIADSVAHFAQYDNVSEHFYPDRPKRAFGDAIARTNDLVLRLREQKRIVPVNSLKRVMTTSCPGVIAVSAEKLKSEYCDREILIQRTRSPAEWEDGLRNIGGLRLDILLADANDHTPIVAELKLPGDMDPYFALIQVLACAAHMATANQYARMRRHLCPGKFPELRHPPRLDAWILFVKDAGQRAAHRPPGLYMPELTDAAERLAPCILSVDAIKDSLRRIVALDVNLSPSGEIDLDVRWAWERIPSKDAANSQVRRRAKNM
jgi:hypothetical protein